jgi:hypothetical protein
MPHVAKSSQPSRDRGNRITSSFAFSRIGSYAKPNRRAIIIATPELIRSRLFIGSAMLRMVGG